MYIYLFKIEIDALDAPISSGAAASLPSTTPENYLQPFPPGPPEDEIKYAEALYDFTPTWDGSLTFNKGDEFQIHTRCFYIFIKFIFYCVFNIGTNFTIFSLCINYYMLHLVVVLSVGMEGNGPSPSTLSFRHQLFHW
jgi:hypothetical protein